MIGRLARRCRTALLLPIVLGGYISSAPAQPPASGGANEQAPRLYIDCVQFFCDRDFFRTEIAFVNHVREPQVADVHVLITSQSTGGGGQRYTLDFIGQRGFAGMNDTLTHATLPTDTEDERRRGLTRVIKIGLVPFLARTPLASRLEVTYQAPEVTEQVSAAQDPWNYWVFRSNVRGNFDGEKSSSSLSTSGSLSANRTTEEWKINVSLNGNYRESRFDIPDVLTITSYTHSYGLNTLAVKSVSSHWSAGLRGSANSSTFVNQDLAFRLAPAIEYNLFAYSESTRRQLTFLYSVGANAVDYRDTTIFGETAEALYDQRLEIGYAVKQPWGTISTSVEGGHYFHDPSKLRGEFFGNMDVRLFRGFSLNFFGSAALIRDQLHLPKEGLEPEEVLLRQRQLATSYRYFAGVGFRYTFGSVYQNVVNPRFETGGGQFFFF